MNRRSFLVCCVASLVIATTAFADAPTSQPATRILFIGNSYTAYNGGIYKIIKQLADEDHRIIEVATSLAGGKSLEFHWNETKAREKIAAGHWDYVVLQDYSTQTLDKKDLFFEYAKKFDAEIKKVGGKTVFYMTWARQNAPEKQQSISSAYQQMADELQAKIAPVGRAWQRVLSERKDLILHFDDKSHPNPYGSYLTACVFYQTLFNAPPPEKAPAIFNQRTSKMDTLDPKVAQYLRQIAIETVSPPTSQPAAAR